MEETLGWKKWLLYACFVLGISCVYGKFLLPQALDYDQNPWLCIYDDLDAEFK